MIIYKITNKLNGKCYIGQTVRTLEERWQEHCKNTSDCMAIANTIQKHGKKNFSIEVVYAAHSIDDLNEKEQEYINKFNTLRPNGYNLTTGGMSYTRSEETKARMSAHQIGKGNHRFGTKASEETKKKMSESHVGMKNHMWGKPMPEGHLQKMLDAQKGKPHPRLGKTFSEESKKKMSDAQKGRPSKNKKPVICHENGTVYASVTEAAKALSIDPSSICSVLKGKRNKAKGYTFSYA